VFTILNKLSGTF